MSTAATPSKGRNFRVSKAALNHYSAKRVAKQNLARARSKLLELQTIPKKLQIHRHKVAHLGSTVDLRYGTEIQSYTLVSAKHTARNAQALAIDSPLGKAILGKQIGDNVLVDTAYGHFQFIVKQIV